MEFFNFENAESFHFFQWIVHSGHVDAQQLVNEAMLKVERSDLLEVDLAAAYLAKEELEKRLRAMFVELHKGWYAQHDMDWERYSIRHCELNRDYADADSLFLALLERAVADVGFEAVAEALLRRAGKWVPGVPS